MGVRIEMDRPVQLKVFADEGFVTLQFSDDESGDVYKLTPEAAKGMAESLLVAAAEAEESPRPGEN